jgi:hypothetical protein
MKANIQLLFIACMAIASVNAVAEDVTGKEVQTNHLATVLKCPSSNCEITDGFGAGVSMLALRVENGYANVVIFAGGGSTQGCVEVSKLNVIGEGDQMLIKELRKRTEYALKIAECAGKFAPRSYSNIMLCASPD